MEYRRVTNRPLSLSFVTIILYHIISFHNLISITVSWRLDTASGFATGSAQWLQAPTLSDRLPSSKIWKLSHSWFEGRLWNRTHRARQKENHNLESITRHDMQVEKYRAPTESGWQTRPESWGWQWRKNSFHPIACHARQCLHNHAQSICSSRSKGCHLQNVNYRFTYEILWIYPSAEKHTQKHKYVYTYIYICTSPGAILPH